MAVSQTASALAVFGRLTWILIGPLALILLTFAIVSQGGGWLIAADVGYFVVLAAMLLGRWLEFHGGSPQKATGEPATWDDLRRYFLVGVPAGLGIWVVANFLGNHWLTR